MLVMVAPSAQSLGSASSRLPDSLLGQDDPGASSSTVVCSNLPDEFAVEEVAAPIALNRGRTCSCSCSSCQFLQDTWDGGWHVVLQTAGYSVGSPVSLVNQECPKDAVKTLS